MEQNTKMGQLLGRYELIKRIGVGGMAEVFLARSLGVHGFVKPVVIKRILPAFNNDPEFIDMFINEACLAAKLLHSNIVQIYDFEHLNGSYHIAMEWVDGTDVRQIQAVARQRNMEIPTRVALYIAVEVLQGLLYAHNVTEEGKKIGLIHRDISPHNVLVSLAGEVKITDFGIAKAVAAASITRSGQVKGKLTYMSPEQVRGVPIDGRSDIYSLGIVLWELLAHRRVHFDLKNESEILAAVHKGKVWRLREVNPKISSEVDEVVHRMLSADPGDRYQSALETLNALAPHIAVDHAIALSDFLRTLIPGVVENSSRGKTEIFSPMQLHLGGDDTSSAETRTMIANEKGITQTGAVAKRSGEPDTLSSVQERRYARLEFVRRGRGGVIIILIALVSLTALILITGRLKKKVAYDSHAARSTQRAHYRKLDRAQRRDAGVLADSGGDDGSHSDMPNPRAGVARHDMTALVVGTPIISRDGSSKRAVRVRYGLLNVFVDPWAKVMLDGKDLGIAPIKETPVPVGSHWLSLENVGVGKREKMRIKIGIKGATTIMRNWREK